MEFQQLKYFKAVADIGKISEAAEALFVSAPALSTSISRLEKELGVQLFDRTNNRITLNAQGQIFLKYTNQIFSSLEEAKKELHQSLLHQGPHISIVSINSTTWVNLITAFTSEFPQYTLSCSTLALPDFEQVGLAPQHSFLLAYESDIPQSYVDKLDSSFLFQTYPTVALHKDHPLASKSEIDISMLAGERIFMSDPGGPLYSRLEQLFAFYNQPFPSENSYAFLARLKMVSENVGITFVTKHASWYSFPNIRYIRLTDPFGQWNARLYWRKDRPLGEYEKVFKGFTEKFYEDLH